MDTHENVMGNAFAGGGRTVTELITVAALFMERATAVRARRAAARADTAVTEQAQYDAARTKWAPFLDLGYRADATVQDAASAWAAAEPYTGTDEQAAEAFAAAEEVMRGKNPLAMSRYDERVRAGRSRAEAMEETGPDFALPGAGAPAGASHPLSPTDAEALHRALSAVVAANTESVRAGKGPVTPAEAAAVVKKLPGIPDGLADRIKDGLSRSTILLAPPAGSVADHGPVAFNRPSGRARRHAGSPRRRGGSRPTRQRGADNAAKTLRRGTVL
jgi:hypothetical protein